MRNAMSNTKLFVSELSASHHLFQNYHFCRGNTSKRKTRIGVILQGSGSYIYLGERLTVKEGDVVFIPENIYCYSEWHGGPEIEVVYLNCFIHGDSLGYMPQMLPSDAEIKNAILQIADLIDGDSLEAYALFYKLLKRLLPCMKKSELAFDKTLALAIEYITSNFNRDFSVGEVARACCVSESALYHLFQRELGQTPVRFLNSIRINVAIEYLENTKYSIATVSNLVAFRSENHFRKVFFEITGTTPLKFRKNR